MANDVAKLNEFNLGCLEGLYLAKEGKMLEDILPKIGTKERQNGVKAGFAKFLSEAAADTDESMNPANQEEPVGEPMGGAEGLPEEPMGGAPEDDFDTEGFQETPTMDSFHKMFQKLDKRKVIDSKWLKCAAFFYVHSPKQIKDGITFQVNTAQGIEYWLNRLLADEFNAWYQYYIVEKFLLGDERPHVQETFKTNADDELNDHAAKLIQRIHDLGYDSSWLTTPKVWDEYASAAFVNPTMKVTEALLEMIKSEMTAIDAYTEACAVAESLGDRVSLDLFKVILADEQEHLANLSHFIKDKKV